MRPPSRTHGVALAQRFELDLASTSSAYHGLDIATRWTAARQFFGVCYYRLGNVRRLARPLRKTRSLAPPILGPLRRFPYLSAYPLEALGYNLEPLRG